MNNKHFFKVTLIVTFIFMSFLVFANGKKDSAVVIDAVGLDSIESEKIAKIVPKRIVSLGASATEILFALDCGDKIVARTDFCNYPAEALNIQSLGGFDGKSFSIETILSYKPDFVYLFKGMHDYLIDTLNQYEIEYYLSDASSVDSVCDEIMDIAKIFNKEQKGAEVVKSIKDSIVKIDSKNAKSVYWEVWNAPYMSVGNDSFINDIIEKAGLCNIFNDVAEGYPIVSEESIIARNPDYIFIPSDSPVSVEEVMNRKGWSEISAIKNKKVFKIDADITSRPGPRIKDAIFLIQNIAKK